MTAVSNVSVRSFHGDFTGSDLQPAPVTTRSRVARCRAFLATLPGTSILRIQQRVQRQFHRPANHFSQVGSHLPLVNLDHLAQLLSPCGPFGLAAHSLSSYQPNPFPRE